MPERLDVRLGRALNTIRLLYGLGLTLRPGVLLRGVGGSSNRAPETFARALGLRQLAEALVLSHRRGPRWAVAGACVDGIHAATMVALAISGGRRRLAIANAAVAAAFAGLGLRQAALEHLDPGDERS